LDKNALIAKMDIKAAFRLLPVYPGDFNLLGAAKGFCITDFKFFVSISRLEPS
jgi:hypothetical protein